MYESPDMAAHGSPHIAEKIPNKGELMILNDLFFSLKIREGGFLFLAPKKSADYLKQH